MNISTKLLKAAAGSAGGAGLDVDEVFSTFLYTGNNSTQTITNNIDLSSEGGMVWTKGRSYNYDHVIYDTARGATYAIWPNKSMASEVNSNGVTAFNSNGYALGARAEVNSSSQTFVSWTWRKAKKWFDIQTWTGTGSARTISHNLGQVPGVIIVKRYSATEDWNMFHRSLGNTKYLQVNGTGQAGTSGIGGGQANLWNNTDPTSTEFSIGTHDRVNTNGQTYIAYIFAHHNNDGSETGFGPNSDSPVISCGSYTGNGSNTGSNSVTLGFEPQFVMIKRTEASASNWVVVDTMRGMSANGLGNDAILQWNSNANESGLAESVLEPTATGFNIRSAGRDFNGNGGNYIYMAIRRGPLAEPTDATKVFAMDTASGTSPSPPQYNSGFPVDMGFYTHKGSTDDWYLGSRLIQGKLLKTNSTAAEANDSTLVFDFQNGFNNANWTSTNYVGWMWKRAPSYFDVVAYTGTGSATTINHNLGVAPEMIWVKSRSHAINWAVYHKDLSAGQYLMLNKTNAVDTNSAYFTTTAPTSSVFSIGVGEYTNQGTDRTYIAYLFATVAGISKVGSYTGNGSSQNIDCGFSSGARFVLIKKSSDSGHWQVYDTARGIVAGNDPRLALNLTSAELTGYDMVDPYSGGFAVTSMNDTNENGYTYIFYAIA